MATTRSKAAQRGWETRRKNDARMAAEVNRSVKAQMAWAEADRRLAAFEATLLHATEGETVDSPAELRRRFYAALVGTDESGYPQPERLRLALDLLDRIQRNFG